MRKAFTLLLFFLIIAWITGISSLSGTEFIEAACVILVGLALTRDEETDNVEMP